MSDLPDLDKVFMFGHRSEHHEHDPAQGWRQVRAPRIEILVVHDPDGGTDLTVFVDGEVFTDYDEHVVDAGAGWSESDWEANTQDVRSSTAFTEPFQAACLDARTDPPGSEHILG